MQVSVLFVCCVLVAQVAAQQPWAPSGKGGKCAAGEVDEFELVGTIEAWVKAPAATDAKFAAAVLAAGAPYPGSMFALPRGKDASVFWEPIAKGAPGNPGLWRFGHNSVSPLNGKLMPLDTKLNVQSDMFNKRFVPWLDLCKLDPSMCAPTGAAAAAKVAPFCFQAGGAGAALCCPENNAYLPGLPSLAGKGCPAPPVVPAGAPAGLGILPVQGLPRKYMPQLAAGKTVAVDLVAWGKQFPLLGGAAFNCVNMMVALDSLVPSQDEVSAWKSANIYCRQMNGANVKAGAGNANCPTPTVTADGYVLDGHHRWSAYKLAAWAGLPITCGGAVPKINAAPMGKNTNIPVDQCTAPAAAIIGVVMQMITYMGTGHLSQLPFGGVTSDSVLGTEEMIEVASTSSSPRAAFIKGDRAPSFVETQASLQAGLVTKFGRAAHTSMAKARAAYVEAARDLLYKNNWELKGGNEALADWFDFKVAHLAGWH